ncbi:hypothetical protein RND71_010026 [Anisodus tanguticus]|uniref:Uncharacterized protein n=1 Tax=Anisodus tanguticus TaxID=243964 RepID=A0AAE1SKU4_9SOLA|nr:hypothetical protein RND71_010026 [Anisodus tanguticus]
MAKKMVNMKPWIEVAPSLFVYPQKNSHSPKLETIKEDDRAELGQDGDDNKCIVTDVVQHLITDKLLLNL